MSDTESQGRKLYEHMRQQKLVDMLQSMSRRWPNTRLRRASAGFGASLADGRFLHITLAGDWNAEDTRDFLALFAIWSVVDFEYLRGGEPDVPHGLSLKAHAARQQSNGRQV